MEEVKEVVQIASEYLKGLIGQATNVRLEQVEEQPAASNWSVILSFPEEPSSLSYAFGEKGPGRVFKEVVVDREQKKATALKVWNH